MNIQPRSYQTEAVQSIYDYFKENQGNPVIAMPTGCHAKGHGILMFDGSIKLVEDIVIGDKLMGPDSEPRTVLALARGRQEMRRIIPNRGEPFVVNLDHKLSVHVTKQGGTSDLRQDRVETITIKQYEEGSDWYRHLRKIRYASVEFPTAWQSIPPYILGLLLGDGCVCNGSVSLTTADFEIENSFKSYCEDESLHVRYEDKPGGNLAGQLNVVDPLANRSVENRLTSKLRLLGLMECRSWQKFIPHEYKVADRSQRLEILAGLIDTDGHYSDRDNCFQFCTTSFRLAEDVKFLIRSLGLRGQIKKRKTSHRDAYTINISGELEIIPTRIKRKKARCTTKQKNCSVMGFSVEKLPEDNFFGFTLDGDHLYLDQNFVVHHNTGKSVVIAMFLQSVFQQFSRQKILVLTHVKELIEQNFNKLIQLWPNAPAGINSAGIGQRDTVQPIIFAGIASVHKDWRAFGHVDLIIIDEAHLVSPRDETMYKTFIQFLTTVNPSLKVIGLTATPWRLGHGKITEDGIFTDFCFNITTMEAFNRLIAEGYLSTLVPRPTKTVLDTKGVHMRGGEFISSELQAAVDKYEVTVAACQEAIECGHDRAHWLVFCSGVQHCINTAEILNSLGIKTAAVHSKLKEKERDRILQEFKDGKYQAVTNNNVLTTGFDFPEIDLIVMLRPTASAVLWVQMLGRGTRPVFAPGFDLDTIEGRLLAIENGPKQNCMVLDFAGNVRRLGPINDPVVPRKAGERGGEAPIKVCPQCATYNHAGVRHCFFCGYEFPVVTKIAMEAATEDLIKKDEVPIIEIFQVDTITYTLHQKYDRPAMIQVTYYCGLQHFKEFVCIEHPGFAGSKAKKWWKVRDKTRQFTPMTTLEALQHTHELMVPTHLRVWVNRKYPEIKDYCFDGKGFQAKELT